MKGKVFAYGVKGDPLLRHIDPRNHERIVILHGYKERPSIGSIVEYEISEVLPRYIQGKFVESQEPVQTRTTEMSENTLESMLCAIQDLWDSRFAAHMTDEAQAEFPRRLEQIRELHAKRDYQEAAKIANEEYAWALDRSDFCERLGPGFAYFPMFQQFKALEELLRQAA